MEVRRQEGTRERTPRFTGRKGRAATKLEIIPPDFPALCGWVGSQRVTLRHFSNCPPPNRMCQFPGIRLSSGLRSRSSYDVLSCALLFETFIDSISLVSGFVRRILASLSHFPLQTAFPFSEYYWDSVTIGGAPVRPSRFPCVMNVIDSRRDSTHDLPSSS